MKKSERGKTDDKKTFPTYASHSGTQRDDRHDLYADRQHNDRAFPRAGRDDRLRAGKPCFDGVRRRRKHDDRRDPGHLRQDRRQRRQRRDERLLLDVPHHRRDRLFGRARGRFLPHRSDRAAPRRRSRGGRSI